MKHNLNVLILILVIILTSCGVKTNSVESSVTVLKGDIIEMDTLLGNPIQIEMIDSILILNDVYSQNIGTILNENNYDLISRFGRLGEGPKETMHPLNFFVDGSSYLYLHSRSRNKIIKYPIEHPFSFEPELILSEFTLKTPLDKLVVLNDSTYLGIGLSSNNYRYIISTDFGKSSTSPNITYPVVDSNFPLEYNYLAFQANLSLKPDKKAFVTASIFCKHFEIIEINENQELSKVSELNDIKLHWTDVSNGTFKQIQFLDEQEVGFLNVCSTDDYIYLLYSGRKKGEYKEKSLLGNRVLVYDWVGNMVKEFVLDNDIYELTVDNQNKTLYGLMRSKNPSIVKYSLLD